MSDPVPNLPDAKPPSGEAFVWFTGVGLLCGLAMVALLVGVIVTQGLQAFGTPAVARTELADGRVLLGPLAQTRLKPGTPAVEERLERQYQVGLREVNGQSYVWVDESLVRGESFPPDALVLERLENGAAFLLPQGLRRKDGTLVSAKSETFLPALAAAVDASAAIRARVESIERGRIGDVNAAMQDAKIALRKAEDRRGDVAAARARVDALEAEYRVLAEEARAARATDTGDILVAVDGAGRVVEVPAAAIVRFWQPNLMGWFDKLGLALERLWEFVSGEPREANTEGGLLPALFGTLVMTVFMSVMVTPFGVIAAIYLREYARQGPVLRLVRISVNNLAGVPSIVFGVFGLGFFVYVLGGTVDQLFFSDQLRYNNNTPVFGTGGLLWASLTLALMTLPVVIVATEEALAAVPRGMREASLACGASKWQTIRSVVLPASAPGILTGVILAMARGAGEVAPLMIVGVVKLAPTLPLDGQFPFLHLDRKFMHLGFHIYDLGFQSPDSDAARPMVFASTLLLLCLVVVLNLGAISIRNRLRERYKTAAF
ncbi:MAG: phosphate ABC transporter permease PstA [Opitutales bacterium]